MLLFPGVEFLYGHILGTEGTASGGTAFCIVRSGIVSPATPTLRP
jgi:hypothetical protein